MRRLRHDLQHIMLTSTGIDGMASNIWCHGHVGEAFSKMSNAFPELT